MSQFCLIPVRLPDLGGKAMAYILSSLGRLPVQEDISLYIFLLENGGWTTELSKLIEANFQKLAQAIGPDAVLVKGHPDSEISEEVGTKYLGKNYKQLPEILPALLLTDAHPEELKDDSMRLLVPLRHVRERFGTFDTFFRLLTEFAKRGDPSFLGRFQESLLDKVLSVAELKPNFFGFGFNLNEAIRRLSRRSKP